MNLHNINLAKSYLMLDDIEIHFIQGTVVKYVKFYVAYFCIFGGFFLTFWHIYEFL